jgi:hypothetical protein
MRVDGEEESSQGAYLLSKTSIKFDKKDIVMEYVNSTYIDKEAVSVKNNLKCDNRELKRK